MTCEISPKRIRLALHFSALVEVVLIHFVAFLAWIDQPAEVLVAHLAIGGTSELFDL